MTKGLCILGSTGSIGRQCLCVVKNASDRFHVFALCAGRNLDLLAQQVRDFAPELVVVGNSELIDPLREGLRNLGVSPTVQIACGVSGQIEAVTHSEVDTVVSASHGTTGLVATYKAIQAGKRIGLANKEVLVAAGELVTSGERAGSRNPACGQRTLRHPSMSSGGKPCGSPPSHIDRFRWPFSENPSEAS